MHLRDTCGTCMGGVGSCAPSPFLLCCLEDVISLHGHSVTKVHFPICGRNCHGTLGTFQGPVAKVASASKNAATLK